MTATTHQVSVAVLALAALGATVSAHNHQPSERTGFARHYQEGERFRYRMTTSNQGATDTVRYSLTADVTVKKDSGGQFYEDVAWGNIVLNGAPFDLPAASRAFRQQLTLEPNRNYLRIPNLASVHPVLVGPITDLLTFYSDVVVATRGSLKKPGDHFRFKPGTTASWADGQHVLIGESSIDFDVTLKGLDPAAGTATLVVQHIPADPPLIKVPADWMRPPVADTANNWVQVERTASGVYTASIGQEFFDVTLVLSLTDGRILSAHLDNPVQVRERECENEVLTVCGGPIRYEIRRKVDLALERQKSSSGG